MKNYKSTFGTIQIELNDNKVTIISDKLSPAEAEIVATEYLNKQGIANDVRLIYEDGNLFILKFD